jgi:hypothetical protein
MQRVNRLKAYSKAESEEGPRELNQFKVDSKAKSEKTRRNRLTVDSKAKQRDAVWWQQQPL